MPKGSFESIIGAKGVALREYLVHFGLLVELVYWCIGGDCCIGGVGVLVYWCIGGVGVLVYWLHKGLPTRSPASRVGGYMSIWSYIFCIRCIGLV